MHKRLLFILVLAATFFAIQVQAQWLTKADESPSVRKHKPLHIEKGEADAGPAEADAWFWHQRTFGLGHIPEGAMTKAFVQTQNMRAQHKGANAQATLPQWSLVGPTNIGGRINSIAINPTNSDIVYVGAANGGVWKSTNGGVKWTPLTDNLQSLSMGSLAIDPQNPNTIYAGTGELSGGINSYSGYGLLRSTDAGATWSDVGPSNVASYARVIVNPKHSNIIYAAAGRSGGGVLRSKDNGTSWEWLKTGLDAGQVTDMCLAMDGDKAVLYAAVASKGLYLSKDGGDTWVHKTALPFTSMRRMSIDCDPKNWESIAVLSVNDVSTAGQDDLEGVQVSYDGGDSWDAIDQTFLSNGLFTNGQTPPQGWYDVYLRADPSNFSHMLVGGLSIWRTDDGGQSWENVAHSYQPGGMHPDQHDAAFAPGSSNTVYVANDGGIFKSSDNGQTYTSSTFPIAITQFYGIGVDQTQPDVIYGGTQDNGTMTGSTGVDWDGLIGGDGTYTLVDPKNPDRIFGSQPEQYPFFIQNGSYTVPSGNTDTASWLNPFAADVNKGTIYWGASRLWYLSGTRWVQTSSKVFGAPSSRTGITAVDAFGDGNTLALGTGGGFVYYSTNNGKNWTDVTRGLPGRYVTGVKFSPSSKGTFYVTYSGYGAGHVFRTTNGGADWTNISSTLPDIPVNSIVMDPTDPTQLYIGSDVGAFYSPNDGAEWMPYGTGLPNTSIVYLDVHQSDRVLIAGTHGRSIWKVPMIANTPGIVQPTQRSVWTIGDSAWIRWRGFGANASVLLSLDGGAQWQPVSGSVTPNGIRIDSVRYATSQNVLVKVTDGTQTLVSPLFQIVQQHQGDIMATVADLPYYLYDIAYDKDDNCLWGTNFSPTDKQLYKIDPDRGTLLGSITVSSAGSGGRNGFTGVKYDPTSKHLFVQEVSGTEPGWTSKIYEVTTTGQVVKTHNSPAKYGTGLFVKDGVILVADRIGDQQVQAPGESKILRAHVSDFDFNALNELDFSPRSFLYGPRGLTYNTKLNQYMLAFTDFQGTSGANAHLDASMILFLDPDDGHELKSLTIFEGGSELTNIRGMEYDPRGSGNTAWITILNTGTSAKLVKIALVDGPSSGTTPKGALSLSATSIDFGKLDTGKTSNVQHITISNIGQADISVQSITLTPSGSAFSMTAPTTPLTVNAGGSITIDVTFAPHAAGQQSASINVSTSEVPATVTLSGEGIVQGQGGVAWSNAEGFDFSVSPNPARDFTTVTLDLEHATATRVQLFDATGREVLAQQAGMLGIGEHDIDLVTTNLASGIYFLRVTGSTGEIATTRVAIEH